MYQRYQLSRQGKRKQMRLTRHLPDARVRAYALNKARHPGPPDGEAGTTLGNRLPLSLTSETSAFATSPIYLVKSYATPVHVATQVFPTALSGWLGNFLNMRGPQSPECRVILGGGPVVRRAYGHRSASLMAPTGHAARAIRPGSSAKPGCSRRSACSRGPAPPVQNRRIYPLAR